MCEESNSMHYKTLRMSFEGEISSLSIFQGLAGEGLDISDLAISLSEKIAD